MKCFTTRKRSRTARDSEP